jgi:hypothetical protein
MGYRNRGSSCRTRFSRLSIATSCFFAAKADFRQYGPQRLQTASFRKFRRQGLNADRD